MKKSILLKVLLAALFISFLSAAELKSQGGNESKEKPDNLILLEDYLRPKLEECYPYFRNGKSYDPSDTLYFHNPYKVMIDTNGLENCLYLWQDDRYYIKKEFHINLYNNIIPRDVYPDKEVIYYTIDDILPQYEDCIKAFREIESKYGKFRFVDEYPQYPDTLPEIPGKQVRMYRNLCLEFDDYVPQLYMTKLLESIEIVERASCNNFLSGDILCAGNVKEDYNNLPLYPSIANNFIKFNLSVGDIAIPQFITIFDNTGYEVKRVYTSLDPEQTILVNDLPSGFYTVLVGNNVGKFIIAR